MAVTVHIMTATDYRQIPVAAPAAAPDHAAVDMQVPEQPLLLRKPQLLQPRLESAYGCLEKRAGPGPNSRVTLAPGWPHLEGDIVQAALPCQLRAALHLLGGQRDACGQSAITSTASSGHNMGDPHTDTLLLVVTAHGLTASYLTGSICRLGGLGTFCQQHSCACHHTRIRQRKQVNTPLRHSQLATPAHHAQICIRTWSLAANAGLQAVYLDASLRSVHCHQLHC